MDWTSRPAIMPPRLTDAMYMAGEKVVSTGCLPGRDGMDQLWSAMFNAGIQPDAPRVQDLGHLLHKMLRELPSDSLLAKQATDYLDRHQAVLQGSPLRGSGDAS